MDSIMPRFKDANGCYNKHDARELGLAAAVKPLAAIGVSALAMAALLFALRPLTAAWPRPLALVALVAAGAAAYGLSVCALLRGEVRRLAGRVML